MNFKTPLTEGVLLRRQFRFLMEIALNNYKKKMVYCPNLGPLLGCDVLGSRIWFSSFLPLSRGYLDTVELVEVNEGHLVGINPLYGKQLVMEALERRLIEELQGYQFLPISSVWAGFKSGLEILINPEGTRCFVCIEQVIAADVKGEGVGYFPEVRYGGLLHLEELMTLRKMGHRAVLFFCVQHTGVEYVKIAEFIEPRYSGLLKEALNVGVEVLAYKVSISLSEMALVCAVPVEMPEMMR
jgi:sugar fermentation stimulation protein A